MGVADSHGSGALRLVPPTQGVSRSGCRGGGTSDGRFIARICAQVIEFGPTGTSIHKVDEHVRIADLEPLSAIYRGILERLLPAPERR